MGQYYKPVNIENMEWIYSHKYGSGLKLMEHSYIGNNFVGAVMTTLLPGGKWHKKKIVWAGDYSDKKRSDFIKNEKNIVEETLNMLAGEDKNNLYAECEDKKVIKPKHMLEKDQKRSVIINHDKKIYFLCNKLKANDNGFIINPLPLLTSDGNGMGGGDYYGSNESEVGSWAGDSISVEFNIPKDYEEVEYEFYEKY